ncbi:DUF3455 domain-containing protein [Methylosoma difficile]
MLKNLTLLLAILPSLGFANIEIPEAVKAPEGHVPYLSVYGEGVQIYQCTLNNGEYAWQIQAPDAQLFDQTGSIVGKHYKGPIWEYKEGSRVQGKIIARLDITQGESIPWMLVKIIGHKGESLFTQASYISRIHTQGGLSPTGGCDSNHLGSEKRISYSADYIFYRSN